MTVRRFNVQVGNNLAISKTYFDTKERDILFIGLIDKITWVKFIKGAATDMKYFARNKFFRNHVHKKNFSLL